MHRITIQVSDELANELAEEASRLRLTVEDLATERLTSSSLNRRGDAPQRSKSVKTNYMQLAAEASRASSARKSLTDIDNDIETARNEW